MRLLATLLVLLTSVPVAGQVVTDRSGRERVIAALERLIATGEPRHTSHDDGQWLQSEVDLAFARGDVEIIRLAQRAAAPIVARVTMPASATTSSVPLTFWTRPVLAVRPEIPYRAAIWISVDGDEPVQLGTLTPNLETGLNPQLPEAATRAGLHHIRVTARVTFPAASGLPPETRVLPDIVYARYDPDAATPGDARLFVTMAAAAPARQLDTNLPEVAFSAWLQGEVVRHGGKFDPEYWRTTYCEERIRESGVPPSGPEICAVIDFMANGAIGRIWIRTGRVEVSDGDVRWLAEPPAFEGMRLGGVNFGSLASVPALLSSPRETWPSGDVAVAAEEMSVRAADGKVRLTAVVRNIGTEPLHGVSLFVNFATGQEQRVTPRMLVIDLGANGSETIETELPMTAPYGVVVIHAMQLGEHTPHESLTPDPTPENSVAFRIVNPRLAPRGYADWLKRQCGPPCRGY